MLKFPCNRRPVFFIFGLSKLFLIMYFIRESRIGKQNETALQNQLIQLSNKIRLLRDKKMKLENAIEKISQKPKERTPSKQYELRRRQLFRDINGFWYYMKSSLGSRIRDKNSSSQLETNNIILEGQDRYNSLLLFLDELEEMDGFQAWRKKEANDLSDVVQGRLHALQHPSNCSRSPKLICNLNIDCGFGCQLHHVVYCLIVAYGSGRTLLLKSSDWNYGKGAFEKVFKPLSGSCDSMQQKNIFIKSHHWWPGKPGNKELKFFSI